MRLCLTLLLALPAVLAQGQICPDGKHCSDGTCCATRNVQQPWGCCPFLQGVCCADRLHCCPQNWRCDLINARCVAGPRARSPFPLAGISIEGMRITLGDISIPLDSISTPSRSSSSAIPLSEESNISEERNVTCPNGQQCDEGDTCCGTSNTNQHFGCCPFTKGTCCSDGIHCCPHDFSCELEIGECIYIHPVSAAGEPALDGPATATAPVIPLATEKKTVTKNMCPDQKKQCSDTATCCQLAGGAWACCPEANAVCCEDHIHCCPHGTKCDVKDRACIEDKHHTMLNLL